MAKRIELLARGLCVEDDRLLVCINEDGGYAYLPGGHVEFGESAAAALVREFREECGIAVTCGSPILGLEISFSQGGRTRHEVSIVFPVKRAEPGTGVATLERGIFFDWWELESLRNRDLRPTHMRDWVAGWARNAVHPSTAMEWISAVDRSHNP